MRNDLLSATIPTVLVPWHWDFANDVLYRLCKKHPEHSDERVVIAKVWLIGRAYAAAIERRKTHKRGPPNFYIGRVGTMICRSEIDKWLHELSRYRRLDGGSIKAVVNVHAKVTRLFSKISGENKRSLASKYLHFHAPNLFFLYDSRASRALRGFSEIVGRAAHKPRTGDRQYSAFAEKCLRLQRYIQANYKVRLTPRQIDRLLLSIADGKGNLRASTTPVRSYVRRTSKSTGTHGITSPNP